MNAETFAEFEARALANGFDEAVVRQWDPGVVLETHTHPFSVEARVVQGEMWLEVAGEVRHLLPGGCFALGLAVPHSERYGDEGATYWVARRNGR